MGVKKIADAYQAELAPVIEAHAELGQADLVIEGGVGTGVMARRIVQRLFPETPYVGTDLFPPLVDTPRQLGKVKGSLLKTVLAAPPRESADDTGSILYANCFDFDLVTDIQRRTGASSPLLFSYNALYALFDRKMNPWERKDYQDRFTEAQMLGEDNVYSGHIHVGVDWSDEGRTAVSNRYFSMEKCAQELGWLTHRTESALVLVAPIQAKV